MPDAIQDVIPRGADPAAMASIAQQERSDFHSPGIDMLCTLSFAGYLTAVSAGWHTVFGWTSARLTAVPLPEFIHPDDRNSLASMASKLLRGHPAVTVEVRFRCRNGSYRWLDLKATLSTDRRHMALVARDITPYKDTEAALKRSNSLLQVLEIVSAAANGAPTTLTRALQLTVDEICARTGWRMAHVLLLDEHHDGLVSTGVWHGRRSRTRAAVAAGAALAATVLASGRQEHVADVFALSGAETARLGLDNPGAQALRAISGFPIVTGGRVVGILEFFAREPFDCDATLQATMIQIGHHLGRFVQRRRYEAALREARADAETAQATAELARSEADLANSAKTAFLSRMSHELRTPLNAVLGYAELLQTSHLPDPERGFVTAIENGGSHLLALINDLLEVTRLDGARPGVDVEPVDPAAVVLEAVNLLSPLAGSNQVSLRTDFGTHVQIVLADRQSLLQIVLNLGANGIKYNRPGGEVVISLEDCRDGHISMAVSDTGQGMSTSDMERIFVPFERLGSGDTVPGTGLGLGISRQLAEAIGGTLEVTSRIGLGSRFSLSLRVATEAQPQSDIETQSRSDREPEPPRLKMLYVDNAIAHIDLMDSVLRSLRPHISLIPSMLGELALDLARAHLPAMILLNTQLPDIEAQAVLRGLRADPETCTIPVVMMLNAGPTRGAGGAFISAGATACVTQPIEILSLLRVIDQATGIHVDTHGVDLAGHRARRPAGKAALRFQVGLPAIG